MRTNRGRLLFAIPRKLPQFQTHMIIVTNTKRYTLKSTQDVGVCGGCWWCVCVCVWGGGGGAAYSMIQQLAIIIATPVCCVCVCF